FNSEQKRLGYYDTPNGDRVIWAYGHLFRLKEPEEYNAEWAEWRMEDLPFPLERFDYVVDDRGEIGALKKRQVKAIKESLPAFSEVVIATDDDREGEVIGWLPLMLLGYRGPIKRIVYSQIDAKALKGAIANMHDAGKYRSRFDAGMGRAVADYVLGLNLTRATTLAFGQSRSDLPSSAGRVQTPVLNLVLERCEAIENFKPQKFYDLSLQGDVDGNALTLLHQPDPKIFDSAEAQGILDACPSQLQLTVTTEEKRRAPPKLFNLNALQGAAATRFEFAPAKTLEILNDLYLKGILTYPRAEPRVLPSAMSADTGALLYHLSKIPELETGGLAELISKHQFKYRSEVYSDKGMEGHSHHAIIPNPNRIEATTLDLASLSADQQKIFLLVARVFIAAHLPDYIYEQLIVSADVNGRVFKAIRNTPVSPGWQAIYQEDPADDDEETPSEEEIAGLAEIADGSVLSGIRSVFLEKMTRPPSYYSMKSLLETMAKLGLGAPSTFANYETILRSRQYIEGTARKVTVTPRGRESLKFWNRFTPELTSPALTVEIEKLLDAVVSGEAQYSDVVSFVQRLTNQLVQEIKSAPPGAVDLTLIQVQRPPSAKQKRHVKRCAERLGLDLPSDCLSSADKCSAWLDAHKTQLDEVLSRPTDQQLRTLDAILQGNPTLQYPDSDRDDRDKVSAFLDAHIDEARFPPSEKMLAFARKRAEALGVLLPKEAVTFADRLKIWIEDHPVKPTPKQLEFAEKIAKALVLELPEGIRASSDICSNFITQHLAAYQEATGTGSKGGSKGGRAARGAKRRRR
ncbi:MAG: hypothetical protein AXW12_19470, partial [Thalassospira sp. Nap_22]